MAGKLRCSLGRSLVYICGNVLRILFTCMNNIFPTVHYSFRDNDMYMNSRTHMHSVVNCFTYMNMPVYCSKMYVDSSYCGSGT